MVALKGTLEATMGERIYLDRQDVYILADWNEANGGGRARLVVCEDLAGASYAEDLSALLGIPLQHQPARPKPAPRRSPPPAPGPPPRPLSET